MISLYELDGILSAKLVDKSFQRCYKENMFSSNILYAARPMEYSDRYGEAKVLLKFEGKGFICVIMNTGTHPCCYVGIKHKKYTLELEHKICCHGGISFSQRGLKDIIPNKYHVLGWDYAHGGDRWGAGKFQVGGPNDKGKEYSTEELFFELIDVLKQLKQQGAI